MKLWMMRHTGRPASNVACMGVGSGRAVLRTVVGSPAELVAALLLFLNAPAPAQTQASPPNQPLDPLAMQWPRTFSGSGYEFAVYQPQISAWPGNQLQGRFATAVRPAGTSNEGKKKVMSRSPRGA